MKNQTPNGRAFTVVELMIVIGVVGILVIILLPNFAKRRRHPPGIKCVNNLKNIGLAFRIYSTDNNDRLPWESTNRSADLMIFLRMVTNELSTPKILICPLDSRQGATSWSTFSRQNMSYFVNPTSSETNPYSIMAGDRNLTTNGVELPSGPVDLGKSDGQILGWSKATHKEQGNICMVDGSVQQTSPQWFRTVFQNSFNATTNQSTTLLVP